jgi:hypothetical protein
VVVTAVADAHHGPCRLRVRLHPFDVDEGRTCWWLPEIDPEGPFEAPVVVALQVLLDHRDDVADRAGSGPQLAAQFGRVLLLGHEVTLAPPTVGALLAASAVPR